MILDMVRKFTSGEMTFSAEMFNGGKRNFNSDLAALFGNDPGAMHRAMRRHGSPVHALRNSTVYRCIQGTVATLSTLPARAQHQETKKAARGISTDVLRRPNDEQTASEFWEMMYWNLFSHGNAFAEKVWIRGKVAMLLPMSAAKTRVERRNGQKFYFYDDLPGETFTAREIMHIRLGGPDELVGLSPLWVAEAIICLDARQREMLIGNAEEGGNPGLVIQIPPEKALDKLRDYRPGGALADKTAIQYQIENARTRLALYLPFGYEATPIPANYRDQQLTETMDANIAALARVWGYPLPKLGVLSKSDNASTVEQADLAWFKDTLRPIVIKVQERLEWELLTGSEFERLQIKINTRAILQGDIKTQTDQLTQLGTAGFITPNEGRDWLDLPRYDDPEADKPRFPVNTTTNSTPAADQPTNPADGGVPARYLPIFEDAMGRITRKEAAEVARAVKSITESGGMRVNIEDRIKELYSGELLEFIEREMRNPGRLAGATEEMIREWARDYAQQSRVGLIQQPTEGLIPWLEEGKTHTRNSACGCLFFLLDRATRQ